MRSHIIIDAIIIVFSILTAVFFVKSDVLQTILSLTENFWLLNVFVAGLFFTSAFTTAPAIVVLGKIALSAEFIWPIAIVGGLGAMCGDLIIFKFIKDRLNDDLMYLMNLTNKRLVHVFKLKFFRWFTFFFGALIIASPLPDELGITLMGLSKTKSSLFAITSLVLNSLGILIISLVARNIFI